MPMMSGSTPATPQETIRPSGATPAFLACSRVVTTTAPAPSLIPLALAAVMVPSSAKAGGSAFSLSTVVSGLMCSSRRASQRLRAGSYS
jgi:hypothetical protein